jgi:hypothetical protein
VILIAFYLFFPKTFGDSDFSFYLCRVVSMFIPELRAALYMRKTFSTTVVPGWAEKQTPTPFLYSMENDKPITISLLWVFGGKKNVVT